MIGECCGATNGIVQPPALPAFLSASRRLSVNHNLSYNTLYKVHNYSVLYVYIRMHKGVSAVQYGPDHRQGNAQIWP